MQDIKDFEGLYKVDNNGNVYSIPRKNRHTIKLLKWDISNKGYARVTLCKNNETTRLSVHRIVAKTFIPNTTNKPFVNHIDNNPLNNNYKNLEWCTHSENMLHAQKQNRLYEAQSKGGKTRGIAGIKADTMVKYITGTIQGNWLIKSFSDKRGSKKYFNVECIQCGNKTTREQSYLLNTKSTSCIKCKRKS